MCSLSFFCSFFIYARAVGGPFHKVPKGIYSFCFIAEQSLSNIQPVPLSQKNTRQVGTSRARGRHTREAVGERNSRRLIEPHGAPLIEPHGARASHRSPRGCQELRASSRVSRQGSPLAHHVRAAAGARSLLAHERQRKTLPLALDEARAGKVGCHARRETTAVTWSCSRRG